MVGDMMKKVLIIGLVAILIGSGLAYFMFNKIVFKDEDVLDTKAVNAFQIGVFSNYDNALKVADRNNGIVIMDNNLYRVYVAILSDKEAIKKVSNYYEKIGLNYFLKEINVSKEFVKEIKEDEELIKKSSSETYNTINLDVLNKYREML